MEDIRQVFIDYIQKKGFVDISNEGDWVRGTDKDGNFRQLLDRRELHKDIYIQYEYPSTWYRFGIEYGEGNYINHHKEETRIYNKFIDALLDIENQPFHIKEK